MTDTTTEQKILNSARELFIKKGMEGTKMQEIADNAGINKALLHYYFRKKEVLFERIFIEGFSILATKIRILFTKEASIEDKIRTFAKEYITLIQNNRFLPMFILHEIQRDPHNIYELIKKSGIDPRYTFKIINDGIDITEDEVRSVFINTLSLCIFPFISEPLLKFSFFNNDQKLFNKFIEERKTLIPEILINSIRLTKSKNK